MVAAVSLRGLPEGGGLDFQDPACYPTRGRCPGSIGTKEEVSTGWQSGRWGYREVFVGNIGGGSNGLGKTEQEVTQEPSCPGVGAGSEREKPGWE